MAELHRPGARHRPFTLLLRLLPQHGAAGRIVGHAEVVATNEVVAIGTEADLVDLIRRLSDGTAPPDRTREVSTTAIGEIDSIP